MNDNNDNDEQDFGEFLAMAQTGETLLKQTLVDFATANIPDLGDRILFMSTVSMSIGAAAIRCGTEAAMRGGSSTRTAAMTGDLVGVILRPELEALAAALADVTNKEEA